MVEVHIELLNLTICIKKQFEHQHHRHPLCFMNHKPQLT